MDENKLSQNQLSLIIAKLQLLDKTQVINTKIGDSILTQEFKNNGVEITYSSISGIYILIIPEVKHTIIISDESNSLLASSIKKFLDLTKIEI